MKCFNSCLLVVNVLLLILFVFFSNNLMQVEGLRPLKEQSFSSMVENFVIQRAYSGPSHRGRGH
uniref:Transmembrane protein n=1 Tax=Solanum tuberosum TaxID=4113 RepID=M1C4T2_SOLTU